MQTFAIGVAELELTEEPLDPTHIVAGTPVVSHRALHTSADGRIERGVWQITPGTVTDVEADEMFVVISGSATIELLTSGRSLTVGPGDVCVFAAGEHTRWTVHRTLRKVYQLTSDL